MVRCLIQFFSTTPLWMRGGMELRTKLEPSRRRIPRLVHALPNYQSTMKTYEIEYDDMPLATVEIDDFQTTAKLIQEMVEFWMGWEENLAEHNGDYTRAWLKNLAMFILRNQRPPKDDEGWVPMDGRPHGITLKSWEPWQPDKDLISF